MHSSFRGGALTGSALLGVALLLISALMAAASAPLSPPGSLFRTDRVLVAFQPNTSSVSRYQVANKLGLTVDSRSRSTYFARLQLPPATNLPSQSAAFRVEAYLAELRKDPSVRLATPDFFVHGNSIPNDPYFDQQWSLRNTGQTDGTPDADIDADEAWEETTGDDRILVAVLDTGVNYYHPDLRTNILTNGNSQVIGYDFVSDDTDPLDNGDHGTICAGIIGAEGNNALGVTGICQHVRMMPVRILDDDRIGTDSDAIAGIDWAREHGARVINCSWSGPGDNPLLKEALVRAQTAGILVVTSVGNTGDNHDNIPIYPASYGKDLNNLLAVTATDDKDVLLPFIGYGPKTVHLAAPGILIISTDPNSFPPYGGWFGGTSEAAAHVSGAAALVIASKPDITAPVLKQRLLDTVDKLPNLTGKVITGGRLNVGRAVIPRVRDTTPPGIPTAFAITHRSRTALLVAWKASGDDGAAGKAVRLDLRYSTAPITTANFAAATPVAKVPAPAASGIAQKTLVANLIPDRTYYLAIRAQDEAGNLSPLGTLGPVKTLAAVNTVFGLNDDAEGVAKFTGESPWAISTEACVSPSRAYTDSPGEPYAGRLNLKLSQNVSTPLVTFIPTLRFQLRTDLEEPYDDLEVDLSRDGGQNWIILASYTGTADWQPHQISLLNYWGESVLVRFRLNTDGDANQDGVWIDDIQIRGDRLVPIDEPTVPPTAPDTLAASAAGPTKINLSWRDRSDTETGFKLERKTAAGAYDKLISLAANLTSYSDSTVAQNTKYTYRLRATNVAGDSANSAEASATTPLAPPAAPGNLTAQAPGSREVQLSWMDRSNNEDSFKIERQVGVGNFAEIGSVPAGTITFRDRTVVPGTKYGYRVRASNSGGASAYSNVASLTTPVGIPSPPDGLTATLASANQIRLNWRDNSTDETGFEVWRKAGGGGEVILTSPGANTITYSDSGLVENTKYVYRVRAKGTGGLSAFAGPVEATTPLLPPAAPTGLQATLDGATAINLAWTDTSTNEVTFRVERRTTGAFEEIGSTNANVKTFRNTALVPNTAYSYRVRARNTGGDSGYSNTVVLTTPRAVGGKLDAPATLAFGSVKAKKTKTLTLTLRNVHASELLKVSVLAPAAPFKLVSGGTEVTLLPGAQQVVTVSFRPTKAKKNYKATLTVRSSEVGKPAWPIVLTGKGK